MVAIQSHQPDEIACEIESVSESSHLALENQAIAELLDEIANLLAEQGAGEFRVRAYQNASKTLRSLATPVRNIMLHDGVVGLIELPTIGHSIANLIEQYLRLGRIPLLDRLRGEETAERLFATLPSIGSELAHRIHEELEIETLLELWAAAKDGRLEKVPGLGRKRIRAIRESLADRLRHRHSADTAADSTRSARAGYSNTVSEDRPSDHEVSVAELLDVDEEYRRLASQGKLTKIAPRHFNPGAVAWLPILHCQRADRHYTAMYSNTARAHELNTTKDWVILYRDDPKSHDRWTVITSQFGKLRGCRIVRGREEECWQHYRHHPSGDTHA
ncbi:DNA polymerase family X protein [Rhodopirellula maiorica SM1]|uniref:DNA polymerase family X protein n=1 Tax=Rhodopirellula maiorica SM1 TaxID=1265738 RepID=M5RG09_9BACT|nr:helix-hairpin-helix domain-containing protein [Rhodopirellula maiorica]EMI18071.1 DNA polymerase family X protein [Rhodopirellula maiorica SM1]